MLPAFLLTAILAVLICNTALFHATFSGCSHPFLIKAESASQGNLDVRFWNEVEAPSPKAPTAPDPYILSPHRTLVGPV